MNERHDMVLEKTYATGAEEWGCPTCGRRMLVNWEPGFKRTILEAGNPNAQHSGFKGGPQMGELRPSPNNENFTTDETEHPIEETRLAPWRDWLDKVDFDRLWRDDDQ